MLPQIFEGEREEEIVVGDLPFPDSYSYSTVQGDQKTLGGIQTNSESYGQVTSIRKIMGRSYYCSTTYRTARGPSTTQLFFLDTP